MDRTYNQEAIVFIGWQMKMITADRLPKLRSASLVYFAALGLEKHL